MDTRECKRCLLQDMGDVEAYRSIAEYVDSLPEETRTPADEYQRRLASCRTCEKLVNGICRVCGCLVEARAARRGNSCPAPQKHW